MKKSGMTDDLLSTFRKARGQCELEYKEKREKPKSKQGSNLKVKKQGPYDSFLDKYNDLENCIDDFKPLDLVYFFAEKSREQGIKYVIANYAKETACAKKLLNNYSSREVCLMIEFLFESGQTYLNKASLSISVLTSSWCNKIYSDSMLWVDDKFVDRKSTKKTSASREWGDNNRSVKIGEWE